MQRAIALCRALRARIHQDIDSLQPSDNPMQFPKRFPKSVPLSKEELCPLEPIPTSSPMVPPTLA